MNTLQAIVRQLRNRAASVYYRDAASGRYIAVPYTLTELAWFRSPAGDL